MLIFGTLGPAGSNHDWVTARYLAFHHLSRVRIELYETFERVFDALLGGEVDHVVQVAVHPSVTDTVARYRGRAHLIDTFLSPSQPMAVLTRSEVSTPRSLGFMTATREYIDTSAWESLVPEPSTPAVAAGLLAGRYDSGVTLARFAQSHPERLRVEQMIGTVVDPWLVYGTEAVCGEAVLAWPESPAGALFRRAAA